MGDQRFYDLDDKDTWQTPEWLIDTLTDHLNFKLGPCAGLFTFNAQINWTIEVPDEAPTGIDLREAPDYPAYEKYAFRNGKSLFFGIDALDKEWDTGGIAWINPPFSLKNEFIDKALDEIEKGNIDGAVILTPDSTDVQSWWHGKLAPNADYVWFSEGRVSFIDPETNATAGSPTFGTALHFVGDDSLWPEDLFEDLSEMGDMMRRL